MVTANWQEKQTFRCGIKKVSITRRNPRINGIFYYLCLFLRFNFQAAVWNRFPCPCDSKGVC